MSPFERAKQKGIEAAKAGFPAQACPYHINPNGCHRRNAGTWGAVFRKNWLRGYWEEQDRLDARIHRAERELEAK